MLAYHGYLQVIRCMALMSEFVILVLIKRKRCAKIYMDNFQFIGRKSQGKAIYEICVKFHE